MLPSNFFGFSGRSGAHLAAQRLWPTVLRDVRMRLERPGHRPGPGADHGGSLVGRGRWPAECGCAMVEDVVRCGSKSWFRSFFVSLFFLFLSTCDDIYTVSYIYILYILYVAIYTINEKHTNK